MLREAMVKGLGEIVNVTSVLSNSVKKKCAKKNQDSKKYSTNRIFIVQATIGNE